MLNTYRPSPEDFKVAGQTLSCREGGQFDRKFQIVDHEGKITRRPTTGWTVICQKRAAQKRAQA